MVFYMGTRKYYAGGYKFPGTYLTVLENLPTKKGHSIVKCICDCGKMWAGKVSGILEGRVFSCGCFSVKNVVNRSTKHGLSNTKLYNLWRGINSRCYYKNGPAYLKYGNRGIYVCDEWRHDPENFISWALENGYKEGLQIDRRDNDGPYAPYNCHFILCKQNNRNRRSSRYIDIAGDKKTVAEWAEINNIDYSKLLYRLNHGWPVEKLFS